MKRKINIDNIAFSLKSALPLYILSRLSWEVDIVKLRLSVYFDFSQDTTHTLIGR